MKLLILMSSILFVTNTTVPDNIENLMPISESASYLDMSECSLFYAIFGYSEDLPVDIQDIAVLELEEELEILIDTKLHLPANFNPLKGKHDLDWSTIELVELEEEIEFDFNTKDYLPEGFNPYAQPQIIVANFCKSL